MLALGFFNPLFLWALPLAAVPIIIHLLNRRRFQKVPWAAMEYLLRALKQNRRRLQMEQWLLLLLRTLAVMLLVFLVSRPLLTGGSGLLHSRTHHIVCLDDSASMAQRSGATNVHKVAMDRVHDLAKKLVSSNDGDIFSLIRSSDREHPDLFTMRVGPQLPKHLREALGGATVGDAPLDPGTLLAKARELAKEGKKDADNIQYYVVTDSRRSDWLTEEGKARTEVMKQLLEMDSAHEQIAMILLGPNDTANLAVTKILRKDRLALAGTPVTMEVEVTNWGDEGTPATEVAIEIHDQTGEVKSRVLRPVEPLAPGTSAVVDVEHTFREHGFHGVVASLPKDRYAVDDQSSLAIEVLATSQVLLVDGDPGDDPERAETFYLGSALDTGGDILTGITVTVIPDHALADYDLGHTNMIWLCNVPAPRADVVTKLEEFLAGGGGLVTFLGNQVNPERYNEMFYRGGEGILPLPLTDLMGDSDRPDHIFVADKTHYSVRVAPDALELILGKLTFLGRYYGMAEDATSAVSVALKVKNSSGSPLLVSKTFKQGGESVVVGTTADDAWSNLCAARAFLIMCQEIHKHGTKVHSLRPYNLSTTGTLSMDLDPSVYQRDALVGPLNGDKLTFSAQERTETEGGEVTYTVQVPMRELSGCGLFQITLAPHQGNKEQRYLARNSPVADGRLQRLPKSGWLLAYPDLESRMKVIEGTDAASNTLLAGHGEVWRFLAVTLLAFMLLETVLAWRFGRR